MLYISFGMLLLYLACKFAILYCYPRASAICLIVVVALYALVQVLQLYPLTNQHMGCANSCMWRAEASFELCLSDSEVARLHQQQLQSNEPLA